MTLVLLPPTPPCDHGTPKAPCCAGCERAFVKAAMAHAAQQKQTEKEAG